MSSGGEGGSPLSSAEIADTLNFINEEVGLLEPLREDQIPQGSVRYDGIAGFGITGESGSLGDPQSDDLVEGVAGTMTANVSFDDNSGDVEIGNLAVYLVRDTDEFAEEFDALVPGDIELISEVSGGFSGGGSVRVDFDDDLPDPAVLSGDMSGSFSDGTSFSVSGDLEADMSVAIDEATGTTFFELDGYGDAGDDLDIEVDGVAQESGDVDVEGFAVEGGF